MKFYLAAPFFNQAQVDLCQKIELAFVDHCVPLFSPRSQHGNKTTKIETPAQAAEVFKVNAENIDDCDFLFAVVDWLLPPGQEVRVLGSRYSDVENDSRTVYESGPLNIPDAGTVWEMGYAYAKGIPVLILNLEQTKLNIMLSQSAKGCIEGLAGLNAFLNQGRLNFNYVSSWKGGLI